MSEIMDSAVLNMPFKMAMSDELSRYQFYLRAQSVLRERDSLKARIESLLATVKREHAGQMAWKRTATQKDIELITLTQQIASTQQQEPAEYQQRSKNPRFGAGWSEWERCSKFQFEQNQLTPFLGHTEYESRKLYAAPVIPLIDLPVPADRSADLSMLVVRLARALAKATPGHDFSREAIDYLKRNNLIGSPLRAMPDAPASHDARTDEMRKSTRSKT